MEQSCELRRIAVIGAGAAGRDMTLRCVNAGFAVTLEDVMPSRLRNAQQSFALASRAGDLHFAATVEDAVRDADLVIDFVPDELESKLEIFSMLDRMAPPRTILCTPTAALSIADLASCTYRPQLCFGLRFRENRSAELTCTPLSSDRAMAAVQQWLRATGFGIAVRIDIAEDPIAPGKLPAAKR